MEASCSSTPLQVFGRSLKRSESCGSGGPNRAAGSRDSRVDAWLRAKSPNRDFDPTEAAVPWKTLTTLGHTVHFATPDGQPGQADERILTGRGVGILKPVLMADINGRRAYAEMVTSPAFQHPRRHSSSRRFGAWVNGRVMRCAKWWIVADRDYQPTGAFYGIKFRRSQPPADCVWRARRPC
jgi:hypothetical protein